MDERGDDESVTAFTMRRIRAEIIEECAKCVPTTWLDPLLTGPQKVSEFKDAPSIEALLPAIAARIRALASAQRAGGKE